MQDATTLGVKPIAIHEKGHRSTCEHNDPTVR